MIFRVTRLLTKMTKPGFEEGGKHAKEKVRPHVDVNSAAHVEKRPRNVPKNPMEYMDPVKLHKLGAMPWVRF